MAGRWPPVTGPGPGHRPAADHSRRRLQLPAPGHHPDLPASCRPAARTWPARHRDPGLRAYAGPHPPASLELKQLSYLIATAPLTDAARAAAWQALASLPGLRTCQTRADQARPRTIDLCIDSADDETLVSVDFDSGTIRAITDRLLLPSPMYPHVHVGTVIGSSTFIAAFHRDHVNGCWDRRQPH